MFCLSFCAWFFFLPVSILMRIVAIEESMSHHDGEMKANVFRCLAYH
jgi:hypothetical protein